MCAVVAIHDSARFAARWYEYGVACGHDVRRINAYESGIQSRLRGCDAFLWQLNHEDSADLKFARSILLGAESQGLRVFPNHSTSWHFDDKIAQLYLLEAVRAPVAPTWVFYSRDDALAFLKKARYPLVFKLRRGAGSLNVRMIRDVAEGKELVRRMFGRGLPPFPVGRQVSEAIGRARRAGPKRDAVLLRLGRAFRRFLRRAGQHPRERGYILLQAFIPANDTDLRITIIGSRAFAFFRGVRPGDFRASGSGRIEYPRESELPMAASEVAFTISRRLGFQSMAFDFVKDPTSGEPVLLEMSYSFLAQAVFDCKGYIDPSSVWHPGHFRPEDLILDDVLAHSSGGVRGAEK